MCTVTVAALSAAPGAGFRLASNRDESRRRAAALPPELHALDGAVVLSPTDPQSGGTWISVNSHGLACTLLNGNPMHGGAPPAAPRSRGTIIPTLWDCRSVGAARERAAALDPRACLPFRLVLSDASDVVSVYSDGMRLHILARPQRRTPLFFTSSGLGDAVVYPPRRALFDRTLRQAADFPAAQDAFHAHTWPDRPHLSVRMARADACTVSTCVLEVTPQEVRMKYTAVTPPAPPVERAAPRSAETGGRG